MLLQNQQTSAHFTIGGKAKGLYKLKSFGVRVPDFVVIPAETFDALLQDLFHDEEAINQRRERLSKFPLTAVDKAELLSVLETWGFPRQPVVVRSSIADEDSAKDAFPGIMDSFLNLKTQADVLEAIQKCAASAYSERAASYRKQRGLTLAARPAVILQKQITPVASGVLFTTFPDYPQEMAVHAAWGFGEGLVQGLVEADEFYFLKRTSQMHREVTALKEIKFEKHEAAGLEEVPVPQEQQQVACLTLDQLQELFNIGTQLEKSFGKPQDVEFVVTAEHIFIVQSRPITQPIPEVVVYDNSNIQESYCGVTTPLTYSFANRAYATVYRQTMQVLALPDKVIQAHEQVVKNLLGLVKGRIYYNINNWYKGLQLLPSFKQNKQDMERMMGLEEPVDFVEDREKTVLQKMGMLPGLLVNVSRLLWAFMQLHKSVPAFHLHFQQHYTQFYRQNLDELSLNELLNQKETLDRVLLQNWTTPIINDFYVMMTNGTVARRLKKAGIGETDEFLSRYLSGDQQIESTQPTKAMQVLAAAAWQQRQLKEIIISLPDDLHQQVQTMFPDFFCQVEAFISRYGDRTVGELKLETLTMRLEPLIFYKYLRNYMVTAAPPAVTTENNVPLHEEAKEELVNKLKGSGAFFGRKVWRSLGKLQQAIRYRESLRLERTRLFGMYRALYVAMGKKLEAEQELLHWRDIFYLTEEEIAFTLKGESRKDLIRLTQDRQLEFDMYRQDDVPSRVIVPSPPIAASEAADYETDKLRGTGCFQGVATGEVVVILDPGSDLNVTGKIVCALRTDPGWAALFPTCLGVLIEKGSALSHSVILLRELGIPTIINVPQLTKRMHSGQRVLLNGGTGEINIIS